MPCPEPLGKVFLVSESGTVVPPLTSAASAPWKGGGGRGVGRGSPFRGIAVALPPFSL